jgi:hypothetical protein
MIDLEDPEAVQQITPPVGEGIQAGTQDHVLLDAPGHPLFNQVFREP